MKARRLGELDEHPRERPLGEGDLMVQETLGEPLAGPLPELSQVLFQIVGRGERLIDPQFRRDPVKFVACLVEAVCVLDQQPWRCPPL